LQRPRRRRDVAYNVASWLETGDMLLNPVSGRPCLLPSSEDDKPEPGSKFYGLECIT